MLLALKTSEAESEPKSMLGWLVPASLALHVVGVVLLPGARAVSVRPRPPLVVEVIDPPPAEPRPEPPPAPTPAPMPTTPPMRTERQPSAKPPEHVASVPREETTPTRGTDAPVDFTSTTFSNDGPGMAIGGGGGGSPAAPPAPARKTATAAATPAFVPAASLGRPPRAPGLDAALEKNYPAEARRLGISGTATLRVALLPDGRVGKVERVSETHSGFGEACERTVRGGRWDPPIDREGHPVATEIKYVCRFEVRS